VGESTDATARCHVYYPNSPATACGHYVTQSDINGSCGTQADPCISTMDGVGWGSPLCNTCYKLTFARNGFDDSTICVDGTCKGYTSVVYIKVVDMSGSDVEFEMSQNAFSTLCPYSCQGGEVCTNDASQCIFGVYPAMNSNGVSYPGSCAVQSIPISYEAVPCGADTGDNNTGAGGNIDNNTGTGGNIDNNTGTGGNIDNNTGTGGNIDNNTGTGGNIDNNTGTGGNSTGRCNCPCSKKK